MSPLVLASRLARRDPPRRVVTALPVATRTVGSTGRGNDRGDLVARPVGNQDPLYVRSLYFRTAARRAKGGHVFIPLHPALERVADPAIGQTSDRAF